MLCSFQKGYLQNNHSAIHVMIMIFYLKNLKTRYKMYTQSQSHGFIFENLVRGLVFELKPKNNDTRKYDIPMIENEFDDSENVNIKSTWSQLLCMGYIY